MKNKTKYSFLFHLIIGDYKSCIQNSKWHDINTPIRHMAGVWLFPSNIQHSCCKKKIFFCFHLIIAAYEIIQITQQMTKNFKSFRQMVQTPIIPCWSSFFWIKNPNLPLITAALKLSNQHSKWCQNTQTNGTRLTWKIHWNIGSTYPHIQSETPSEGLGW